MRDEDHGGIEIDEIALEPLERRDVEVIGRLVQEQQVGVGGEHARERRTGELAAREGVEAPVELGIGESKAVQGCDRPLTPVPATGMLEPPLRARVAVEQVAVLRALRHLALQPAQLVFERHQVAAAGEHVVAQ